MALSMDIRTRAIRLLGDGLPPKEVAQRLLISKRSVERFRARSRSKLGLEPSKPGPKPGSGKLSKFSSAIEGWVRDLPGITVEKIVQALAELGARVSSSTARRALFGLHLSYKKKTTFAAEQDREDVAEARTRWRAQQPGMDASQLVFIDETGLNTKMASLRGWSRSGTPCVAKTPHGHWKSSTFIAALRSDGVQAPWLLDGPLDGPSFLAYLESQLLPTLREGDVVVCDNLSTHKVAGASELVASVGAKLLYLPPYSPDLNPIEKAFSKLKSHLRSLAARTFDELVEACEKALGRFTPIHCANFFKSCNYAT
jgi:transposase